MTTPGAQTPSAAAPRRRPPGWSSSPSEGPSALPSSDRNPPLLRLPRGTTIRTALRAFDPTSSGRIDAPALVVAAMSLGLRVTIEEILRDVSILREEEMRTRGGGGVISDADFDDDDDDDDCKGGQTTMIDLALATRILMRQVRGWDGEDEEARAYFGLFDGGGKGYVTLDDLRRVRDEIGEAEREMLSDAVGDGDAGAVVVGDAALRRMIEQFDDDRDGVVDYREFGNLLSPLFPSPDLVD